jgi:hypothetical protein
MSSLLMQAAQSAAQADGLAAPDLPASSNSSADTNNFLAMQQQNKQQQQQQMMPGQSQIMSKQSQQLGGGGKNKGPPLRRGKWTAEEEAYANRLIQEFKAGLLPLTDGTTLRTFLSKLLNCDPMRISKKFVGGNCIGKQVFRRRTADLNRLTPEQIQQSRAELSELERRFLERVAQTNRVKTTGVGGGGHHPGGPVPSHHPSATGSNHHHHHAAAARGNGPGSNDNGHHANILDQLNGNSSTNNGGGFNGRMGGGFGGGPSSNPPWLQPPLGYKHGQGAAMAAAGESNVNSRAAAAGRALLQGLNPGGSSKRSGAGHNNNNTLGGLSSRESAGLLAMAELQRRASQQNILDSPSAQNLLAALGGGSTGSMAQLARNASGTYINMHDTYLPKGNGTIAW